MAFVETHYMMDPTFSSVVKSEAETEPALIRQSDYSISPTCFPCRYLFDKWMCPKQGSRLSLVDSAESYTLNVIDDAITSFIGERNELRDISLELSTLWGVPRKVQIR